MVCLCMYRISLLQADASYSGQTGEVPPLLPSSQSEMHCQPVPGIVSDICDRPCSPKLQKVLISRKIICTIVYNTQFERLTLTLSVLQTHVVMQCNILQHLTPKQIMYYCKVACMHKLC